MRAQIFPGQGGQTPNMGQGLYLSSPYLRRAVAEIFETTGVDLTGPLLDGPIEGTIITQLGIFVVSVALAEHLAERGHRPALVAGHSLGEFSALVAGGWLSLRAGSVAVAERAAAMHECCTATEGAMFAILGLPVQTVADLCAEVPGAVLANMNAPTQTVVSGTRTAVGEVATRALAHGAADAVQLNVAGAFHSPLMLPAALTFRRVAQELPLRRGHVPLVSSVTAQPVDDLDAYRQVLAAQITDPVRWEQTVRALIARGCTSYLEVGPGRALRGLVRRIDRSLTVESCCDYSDLDRFTDVMASS